MIQLEFRFETEDFEVEHQGKKLIFVLPTGIKSTYSDAKSDLKNQGVRAPTFAETVSLIYAFSKTKIERRFEEFGLNKLREAYEGRGIWGFTGLLYMPEGISKYENGIIIQDNPEIVDGKVKMELTELVKNLESGNSTTRFVQYAENPWYTWDVPDGKISQLSFAKQDELKDARNLAKNSLILALVGEEGANKLAEIAARHEDKPGFGIISKDSKRPIKPLLGLVSIREEETEHNYYNPGYTRNLEIDCLNQEGRWDLHLHHAVGIREE